MLCELQYFAERKEVTSANTPQQSKLLPTCTALIKAFARRHGVQRSEFPRTQQCFFPTHERSMAIVSNSFFGETAAEVGNVPFVFYGEHCMPVHL